MIAQYRSLLCFFLLYKGSATRNKIFHVKRGMMSEIMIAVVPSQVARRVSLSSGGCRKELHAERQN